MIKILAINNKEYIRHMENIKLYIVQWSYKNNEYQTKLFFNRDNQEIVADNEHIKKNKNGEFSGYSGKVTNSKIAKREVIEEIKEQLKNELIRYMN